MKELGYHRGYKYAHDYAPDDPAAKQQYLPHALAGKHYYRPQKTKK